MNTSSKTTISEQIYQQLRWDIIHNKIPCGQKLTLKMLKEQFNVSHTPIREALTRLSEEGLINYYSNCGVNVVSFTSRDIKELFQFISKLDAVAVEFCQYSYSSSPLLFDLKELLDISEKYLQNQDLDSWKGVSEDFHLVFYKYAENHYLENAARTMRARISLLSNLYSTNENARTIQDNHYHIYELIKDQDFEAAARAMQQHSQEDVVYALRAFQEHDL